MPVGLLAVSTETGAGARGGRGQRQTIKAKANFAQLHCSICVENPFPIMLALLTCPLTYCRLAVCVLFPPLRITYTAGRGSNN
jgi:hypothetical protein